MENLESDKDLYLTTSKTKLGTCTLNVLLLVLDLQSSGMGCHILTLSHSSNLFHLVLRDAQNNASSNA